MGVIKKVIYRGNFLGKQRHNHLFLDMEENIHIHYRDLRIELSRAEFENIVSTFRKQSDELLAIIRDKSYQDGVLANANQDDVRIWTESLLKNDVKYHPLRFSLEECNDGYHFHYRNYKLLIDPAEFRQIAQLFKAVDMDSPYASSYEEVLDLLEANDVDFLLAAGNEPGETLAIAVAKYHMPKIRAIFDFIGFTRETQGAEQHYHGSCLKVIARVDGRYTALDYKRMRENKAVCSLVEYFSRNGGIANPNDLNRVSCQVIDLYSALKSGQSLAIETDPQTWLYSPGSNKIIFPYKASGSAGKEEADVLYRAWNDFLKSYQPGYQNGYIKPAKDSFAPEQQKLLQQQVMETLRQEVFAVPAVEKVYLMGSGMRGDLGKYQVPFVYGALAKLGSDVDILIEIHSEREGDIPKSWPLYMPSAPNNQCAVYHIAQVPLADGAGDWPQQYPHVQFVHHLIDAYAYFPSRSSSEQKDAFLRQFDAKLIYDRSRDGAINRGEDEQRIAGRVSQLYSFQGVAVEKMAFPTQNVLYRVLAEGRVYILKLLKVGGNYKADRVAEHAEYEAKLINQLCERGVQTAGLVPTLQGGVGDVEGCPALLFERLAGTVCHRPEYPIDKIAANLATMHRVQIEHPLDLAMNFLFEEVCAIWLTAFRDYAGNASHSAEIAAAFAKLAPLGEKYRNSGYLAKLFSRSPAVHNHGDVKPQSVVVDGHGDVRFFDFNNAFYGSRLFDVIGGAFEFSLAEGYIDLADFARFDVLLTQYAIHNPFTAHENSDLLEWIGLVGIIMFTKEIRALLENTSDNLRRRRALAIADFIALRTGSIVPQLTSQ